jgi:hypothetical protein
VVVHDAGAETVNALTISGAVGAAVVALAGLLFAVIRVWRWILELRFRERTTLYVSKVRRVQ